MTDLTKGNETKSILLFSLPMIAGNMLQQLYNVADTLIVGRFLGTASLGAVGSSFALMVLLTSIIIGLCLGSGVVFSQLYGAKRLEDLKLCIGNSFIFIFLCTIIIFIFSLYNFDSIIAFMNIPKEAVSLTKTYLFYILLGLGFTFLYNFLSAILRSLGNSLTPLLFLAFSAVLNIILDLVLILKIPMGVAGASIATVISQGVSAIGLLIYFLFKMNSFCPRLHHFKPNMHLLKLVLNNSVLTSIQQSIMNFGILMIQGLVNGFGINAMAAFAAVVKIDAFAYMPVQDFGNAFAIFVAQNIGANEVTRIKKGTIAAVKASTIFCIIISIFVYIFSENLMHIFINPNDIEVIKIGVEYLRIEGVFYVGIGYLFLLYCFYRGLGKSQMSIILTVISLGTRVGLSFMLSPIDGFGLNAIWWSIPIGWFLADIFGVIYYKLKKDTLFNIKI